MKTLPLVTVIIPTYNRAGFVCSSIASVLGQTYRNVEIVVVDDGSTDDTQVALAQFGNRIKVITQQNSGPAAARNRGVAQSAGDILAFLDSDDIWLPAKLERQVELLRRAGEHVTCCVCNTTLAFEGRQPGTSFGVSALNPPSPEGIWTNPLEVLSSRFLLFNQAVAIRRGSFMQVGGFTETYKYMEDYDLALRLALIGPFAYISEPLVIWNQGTQGSLTQSAAGDDITCCGATAEIRDNIFQLASLAGCSKSTRRHLKREKERMQRMLRAKRMMRAAPPGERMLGNTWHLIESLREAAFSRTPWFPRMNVLAVDAAHTAFDNGAVDGNVPGDCAQFEAR